MLGESGGGQENDEVRVLVVDDDPEVAQLASDYLEHTDSTLAVEVETSARAALDRLAADDQFDCIVSDYDMPGMDGLELLDAVRERESGVPFILFTSQGGERFGEDEPEGVTEYIRKDGQSGLYAELADRVTSAAT